MDGTTLEAFLPRRGWQPDNHRSLLQHLQGWNLQRQSPAPLAIFDWDNTCIFNDIADATLRHQLEGLHLQVTPEELRDALPEAAAEARLTLAADAGAATVSFGALRHDILQAYAALWPAIAAGQGASQRGSEAQRDFAAKMGVMYHALEHTPEFGAPVAYPWLVTLYRHLSWDAVEQLAQRAWQAAHAEPVGTLQIGCATAGQAGRLSYRMARHLHLYQEMAELMAALQHVGVEVGIVTASYEPIVRGVARLLGVVPRGDAIVGMRMPLCDASRRSGEAPPIVTYRQGKVDAITANFGCPPVLVAGDANTDYEMLTYSPRTAVRLVIHRPLQGPIAELHQQALRQPPGSAAAGAVLLQGRDPQSGLFWPRQLSGDL